MIKAVGLISRVLKASVYISIAVVLLACVVIVDKRVNYNKMKKYF